MPPVDDDMKRNKRRSPVGKECLWVDALAGEVVRKPIKHLYLRVVTPDGTVRVSAPKRMSEVSIRRFVGERLEWIRRHQARLQKQAPALRFTEGEHHLVWGEYCRLHIEEEPYRPGVERTTQGLCMRVKRGTDADGCKAVLDDWYRAQIRAVLPALLETWQPRLGVRAGRVTLRRMETRWGSCTPHTGNIRLNTALAKWPPECLEYVLVHELVHLLEASHNHRFKALMDSHFPDWREYRTLLDRG